MKKVCAIIPAYNEAKTVALIVKQTIRYVDQVFVVDDCSSDNTGEIAAKAGATVVTHEINYGSGAALHTGCETAIANGFDYVVQVDGDGQHSPRYIPEMLEMIKGCDIVIASRFLNMSYREYPLVRRIGIRFFSCIVRVLTKAHVTDVTSGYRLYRTEGLKKLRRVPDRHWAIFQTITAAKKGLIIKEVSARMPIRHDGNSQFSLRTYCLYPLKMVIVIFMISLAD